MKKGNKKIDKKIVPFGDGIFIKKEEKKDEVTEGGIIIPSAAKKEFSIVGVVVAVGAGRMTEEGKIVPVRVRAGDSVLFKTGDAEEITIAEKAYWVIRETDVIAFVK